MSGHRQASSSNGRAALRDALERLSILAQEIATYAAEKSSDEDQGASESGSDANDTIVSNSASSDQDAGATSSASSDHGSGNDSDSVVTATSFSAFEGRYLCCRHRWVLHFDSRCANCDEFPIVGTRHQAVGNKDVNVCGDCVGSAIWHSHEGMFVSYEAPWDAFGEEGRLVPKAPLSPGDRGFGVYYLQNVLTNLRFMNIEDTDKQVGVYGAHTAAAIVSFANSYMKNIITAGHNGGYDDMVENYLILHVARQ